MQPDPQPCIFPATRVQELRYSSLSNLERYENSRDGQIRKPQKDELFCTSFVEVSNATLGNGGTVLYWGMGIDTMALLDFLAVVAIGRPKRFIVIFGWDLRNSWVDLISAVLW